MRPRSVSTPSTARPTLYTASPTRASPLGLLDQRAPVLGVIYTPFLDHLHTGVRGAGLLPAHPPRPHQ
ncbi:hypothetical protein BC826DRAFT_990067 [Russula brevipes]|nr:hypothetical protein BC826DRAFT_990067 [Russula brevipes]